MKNLISMICIVFLITIPFTVLAEENYDVTVTYNGEVILKQQPVYKNGSLMVPMEDIADKLGLEIKYNEKFYDTDDDNIVIYRYTKDRTDKFRLLMPISYDKNNETTWANVSTWLSGKIYPCIQPGIYIENDKTYVPIRRVLGMLGFYINWNQDNYTVNITSKDVYVIPDYRKYISCQSGDYITNSVIPKNDFDNTRGFQYKWTNVSENERKTFVNALTSMGFKLVDSSVTGQTIRTTYSITGLYIDTSVWYVTLDSNLKNNTFTVFYAYKENA